MRTDPTLVFRNACQTIAQHRLLRAIDWYADCAATPPPSSLKIDYGSDGLGFPRVAIDWKNTPEEVVIVAEHANGLYYQRFVVTDTTRKLCFGMTALSEFPITDHDGLIAIEYHAESYFVRAGALGEQIVRLAAWALRLPNAEEGRIEQLVRQITTVMPGIAADLDALRHAVGIVKSRRNEAAHESTYSDERLSGLRAMLSPSAAFGHQPWEQHIEVVTRYRTVFLAAAAEEMTQMAQRACVLFDYLVTTVDGYSDAELTRQRIVRESRGDR